MCCVSIKIFNLHINLKCIKLNLKSKNLKKSFFNTIFLVSIYEFIFIKMFVSMKVIVWQVHTMYYKMNNKSTTT